MQAAGSGNLAGFQLACIPEYYSAFISYFGEQKLKKAQAVYEALYRYGLPHWEQYRYRANLAADEAYQRLHAKVATLGREAYNRLGSEERMQLISERGKYDDFVFGKDIQALAEEERKRIKNVEAFRQNSDRRRFVEEQGWNSLSAEDRAALGSPAALSSEATPEKLAFIDRITLPSVNPEAKKEIEEYKGMERTRLQLMDSYTRAYGSPQQRADAGKLLAHLQRMHENRLAAQKLGLAQATAQAAKLLLEMDRLKRQ